MQGQNRAETGSRASLSTLIPHFFWPASFGKYLLYLPRRRRQLLCICMIVSGFRVVEGLGCVLLLHAKHATQRLLYTKTRYPFAPHIILAAATIESFVLPKRTKSECDWCWLPLGLDWLLRLPANKHEIFSRRQAGIKMNSRMFLEFSQHLGSWNPVVH